MLVLSQPLNGVNGLVTPDTDGELINKDEVTVDPAYAQELMRMFPYARQRPLSKATVDMYVDHLENGTFFSHSELRVLYAPDENGRMRGYLVNGQHRLHAVIKWGGQMVFTITHLEVGSMDEVHARYAVEDSHKARTVREQGIALGLAEEFRLTLADTTRLATAALFIGNRFLRPTGRINAFVRADASREYAHAMRVMVGYLHGGTKKLTDQLRRQGALGVALVTIKDARQVYGGSKIEEFWHGIALDDGLRIGDPRKVVVRHLQALVPDRQHKSKGHSVEYTARLIANCYNAWVLGKELLSTRVPDERCAIAILGTKWKGK